MTFFFLWLSESCREVSQSLSQHKELLDENIKQILDSCEGFSERKFPEAFKILKKGQFKTFCKNCKNLFDAEKLEKRQNEIKDAKKEIADMIDSLSKQEITIDKHIKNFDKQLSMFCVFAKFLFFLFFQKFPNIFNLL